METKRIQPLPSRPIQSQSWDPMTRRFVTTHGVAVTCSDGREMLLHYPLVNVSDMINDAVKKGAFERADERPNPAETTAV